MFCVVPDSSTGHDPVARSTPIAVQSEGPRRIALSRDPCTVKVREGYDDSIMDAERRRADDHRSVITSLYMFSNIKKIRRGESKRRRSPYLCRLWPQTDVIGPPRSSARGRRRALPVHTRAISVSSAPPSTALLRLGPRAGRDPGATRADRASPPGVPPGRTPRRTAARVPRRLLGGSCPRGRLAWRPRRRGRSRSAGSTPSRA